MKRFASWIGLVISLVCIGFFVHAMAPHWSALSTAGWTAGTWLMIGLGLCLFIATYASATRAWQISLRMIGKSAKYAELARVLTLSQFAKYLPGNVGHHVGRVVLAQRIGLSVDTIVTSMVLDTMVLLVAALACSVPAFALMLALLQKHGAAGVRVLIAALALAVFGLAVLALAPVARRALIRYGRLIAQLCHRRTLPLLAQGCLVHSFAFLFGATALYLVCSALNGTFTATWLPVLGIYTVAWLLGFVMPGAPAGIGIREVSLLVGLTPLYGESQATAAAAILRLLTTGGDGLVFLFALVYWRRIGSWAR